MIGHYSQVGCKVPEFWPGFPGGKNTKPETKAEFEAKKTLADANCSKANHQLTHDSTS